MLHDLQCRGLFVARKSQGKDQRDHYDESTTDSAILHLNFVGVFHHVAEGEPIKIRQM